MLRRYANFVDRHARPLLAGAFAFIAVAGMVGGPVAGKLSSSTRDVEDPSSQSVEAREGLARASGVNPDAAVVAIVTVDDAARPAARRKVERVAAIMRHEPAVGQVFTTYNTHDHSLVSKDSARTIVAAAFKPLSVNSETAATKRISEALKDEPGVQLGGPQVTNQQLNDQIREDLARAELFAFPILFLLSLLVFRGFVAALVPMFSGVVAILGTFLCLRLLNSVTPLSIFALNLVVGLGLGLAIDYSLFVISRYREELARVGPGPEALYQTLTNAGRTVAFSALTVVGAVACLLVFPQPFIYSMGAGAICVGLLSAANCLIVLPALLSVLGPRINALAPAPSRRAAERSARREPSGFWYRFSHAVMRRPALIATLATLMLLIAGIPFLSARFVGVDASVLPERASARQAFDSSGSDFPAGTASPIYLAIEAPRSAAEDVATFAEQLRRQFTGAEVRTPVPVGANHWRIDVVSNEGALTDTSRDLVQNIRSRDAPFPVRVGGETAGFVDQVESLKSHLPIALAILGATTLFLLFVMTGSVVLPVKALVMNLLTLSATFGILVLIFQDGRFESLLGYTSQGALNLTQPVLIAVIVFALSTDYGVFLLTRIKEARDSGLNNTEAVATGLERTGGIVTAAALLFTVAIGAFSTSAIVFIKELGVGMCIAVILDATIVRALLVPSLMALLGERNWWAPAPLRRWHDRFGVHETPVSAPSGARPGVSAGEA